MRKGGVYRKCRDPCDRFVSASYKNGAIASRERGEYVSAAVSAALTGADAREERRCVLAQTSAVVCCSLAQLVTQALVEGAPSSRMHLRELARPVYDRRHASEDSRSVFQTFRACTCDLRPSSPIRAPLE